MSTRQSRTRRYRITDQQQRELGEASGTTRAEALFKLYRLAHMPGVKLSPDKKRLIFKSAPHVAGVRQVHFERVA